MKRFSEDIESILVSEEEIDDIIEKTARQIDEDYKDKNLLLLCILKGSVMFFGDLLKKITVPAEIDFIRVSSYSGTESSGTVRMLLDVDHGKLKDCDVLVVEDIIDSGRTLTYLCEYLKFKGAKSVRTCTLLDKPDRRVTDFVPDYTGVMIPDEFVVGYGLDYDEKYRTLPYIGILKPEVYEK